MWSQLRVRLRALVQRGRAEADLDEELRFHLDRAIQRNVERGMRPEEARHLARQEFGGLEQIKEACREERGTQLVDAAIRDLQQATRRLRRDWRFTAAASLILALGIGANTSIFSLVNAAMFREQPFAAPERLVNIYQNVSFYGTADGRGVPEGASYPVYRDIAQHRQLFSGVAASFMPNDVRYQSGGRVRSAVAEFATSTYLQVLGLRPTIGRWFLEEEDAEGAAPVAVVSHHAWRHRFDGDPTLVGRTLRVGGIPVTVVGIGPEGHNGTLPVGVVTDFWMSISALPAVTGRAGILSRKADAFLVKARLRDGVPVSEVRAAMDALGTRLAEEYPDLDPGLGLTVLRENEVRVHPLVDEALAPGAAVLLLSVALVLAIACSNLATLLLVRGAERSREISLRLSLGASRAQVVRHLVAESLLLSSVGGAAGCALAVAIMRLAGRLDLPIVLGLRLDVRVLAFALVLSLLTGIAIGLLPAMRSTRLDPQDGLRQHSAGAVSSRRFVSVKNALLAAQLVVSFFLLVSMSFSLRHLAQSGRQDVGFAVDGVAMLETDGRYAGYSTEQAVGVLEELRRRVAALPGVHATTLASGTPMKFAGSILVAPDGDSSHPRLPWIWAEPDLLDTLDVELLFGRFFRDSDQADTDAVAVVNETMAQQFFGTRDAVGRTFRVAPEKIYLDAPTEAGPQQFRVIGVAADTLTADLTQPRRALFYRSLRQADRPPTTVLARSSLGAEPLLSQMQRELVEIDAELPILRVATMEQILDGSLAAHEMVVGFLASLALVGLALAGIGLFAVVSHDVTQRRQEIGIRTALGARPTQVTRAVASDVLKLLFAALGLAAGLSFALIQVVQPAVLASPAPGVQLSVPAIDAGTLPAVALLMLAVGMMAAYLPARRATKVDPLVVLRHD